MPRTATSKRRTRRLFSALSLSAYLLAVQFSIPAQAAIGSVDTECQAAGFDFGIERWGFETNTWSITDSGTKSGDYSITVSGTDHVAVWTASPGVDGVLAKAGSESSGGGTAVLGGGTSGTITVSSIPALGGHGLSHVTFCGNSVVEPLPSPSAAASSSSCDDDGTLGSNMGGILVTVADIDATDVTVTIGGAPGIVGTNPMQAGTYTVLVSNNLDSNSTILSKSVTVADCTPISRRRTEVLGARLSRGLALPATGTTIPVLNTMALAFAAILLGLTLTASGRRRDALLGPSDESSDRHAAVTHKGVASHLDGSTNRQEVMKDEYRSQCISHRRGSDFEVRSRVPR